MFHFVESLNSILQLRLQTQVSRGVVELLLLWEKRERAVWFSRNCRGSIQGPILSGIFVPGSKDRQRYENRPDSLVCNKTRQFCYDMD